MKTIKSLNKSFNLVRIKIEESSDGDSMNDKFASKFYNFSVILWDYLIGNGMFLLFNIAIPLAFFLLKAYSPLALIILIFIVSLNVLPSFIALKYTYFKKTNQDDSIIKLFIKGYKLSIKESIKASALFTGLLLIFYVDYLYFSQRGWTIVAIFFIIAALVLSYFIMSYANIHARFSFSIKETLQLSMMYMMKMIKPVAMSLLFLFAFFWFLKAGAKISIFFMFAAIAKISNTGSKHVLDEIYYYHTEEGIKEREKNK